MTRIPKEASEPRETKRQKISLHLEKEAEPKWRDISDDLSMKSHLLDTNARTHLPSGAELEELDHIAVNLAYQVYQLLSKFQWLKGIDLNQIEKELSSDKMLLSLFQSARVRLASRLVQQYWNEGIPLFDYILAPRFNHAVPQIPEFCTSNLSEIRARELNSLALDSLASSAETLQKKINGDSAFFCNHAKSNGVISMLSKGSEFSTTSYKLKKSKEPLLLESSTWPPPLPKIKDPKLYRQVFTHKSSLSGAPMKSAAEVLCTHNERLEFKGDSILDFFICELLFDLFPENSEGDLTVKKASLVCNDTLFDISVAYKLHKQILISSDLRSKIFRKPGDELPDMGAKNKALADVFEAYIAGVALSYGLKACHDWLRELFAPMINSLSSNSNIEPERINKNAKNELYRQIGSAEQPIEYRAENSAAPFVVRCIVGGEVLGRGEGLTLKAAGLKAAENALRIPSIVERFAAKRRNTPKMAPTTSH